MTGADNVSMRPARRDDVPAIVRLLADDILGKNREQPVDPLPQAYWEAFDRVAADPRNLMAVAEDAGGTVIGCLQLTFIPTVSRQGAERLLLEAVRVASSHRGRGIGHRMLRWAIDEARGRGCSQVELFTDKVRSDAQRFYADLGFVPSHVGMKLHL